MMMIKAPVKVQEGRVMARSSGDGWEKAATGNRIPLLVTLRQEPRETSNVQCVCQVVMRRSGFLDMYVMLDCYECVEW